MFTEDQGRFLRETNTGYNHLRVSDRSSLSARPEETTSLLDRPLVK
jgi:hypothetical protein